VFLIDELNQGLSFGFFINANDMLDKNGKSNPKSYWK
jgi:hypothetical protein